MLLKFAKKHRFLFVTLTVFVIGCPVRFGEGGRLNPGEKQTPANSAQMNLDHTASDLSLNAMVTTDRSKGWRKTQKRLGSDDWIDVCFVDSNVGWIVSMKGDHIVPQGGSIFKTEDGGGTWRKLPLEMTDRSFISDLSFIDRSRGWLVVQTLGREVTRIEVLATSDGGETWLRGFTLEDAIASRMAFNGRGEGWIVGIKAKAAYLPDQKSLVLHTRDFGKSWLDATKEATNGNESGEGAPFEDLLVDILFDESLSQSTAISKDGKIWNVSQDGERWNFLTEVALREPYSRGFSTFSRITKLNDGGFLTVSGADGPHGTWTFVSVIHGDSRTSSLLPRIVITDMQVLDSGEVIASGLRETDSARQGEVVSAVVLSSSDFSNWKIVFGNSAGCKFGCKLNAMSRRGDGYYFAGTDGLLVSMDRN